MDTSSQQSYSPFLFPRICNPLLVSARDVVNGHIGRFLKNQAMAGGERPQAGGWHARSFLLQINYFFSRP